jgi:hypothetical protein
MSKIVKDPFAADKPAVALLELSDHHNHSESDREMTESIPAQRARDLVKR